MRNERLRAIALVAILGATAGLPAQTNPGTEGLRGVKSKAELEALVSKLRSGQLKGPQTLFEGDKGPYRIYTSYIDNRKGVADIHALDDEVFVVLSGSAQCTLGGDIADKKLIQENEYRGTQIVGGVTRPVAAGDIVSAPHGTAHQMDPGAGHVLYVVIKMIKNP